MTKNNFSTEAKQPWMPYWVEPFAQPYVRKSTVQLLRDALFLLTAPEFDCVKDKAKSQLRLHIKEVLIEIGK